MYDTSEPAAVPRPRAYGIAVFKELRRYGLRKLTTR